MSSEYWWYDYGNARCIVCNSTYKSSTPSALARHSITAKHSNNLQLYNGRNMNPIRPIQTQELNKTSSIITNNNTYWWYDYSNAKCIVCNSTYKSSAPSALNAHSITAKHTNNLQVYNARNKNPISPIPSQDLNKISQARSEVPSNIPNAIPKEVPREVPYLNVPRRIPREVPYEVPSVAPREVPNDVPNEVLPLEPKSNKKEDLLVIKSLYNFYFNSNMLVIPCNPKLYKGRFLKIINETLAPNIHEMISNDVYGKPFSLFFKEINESRRVKRVCIIIRYYSDQFKKFITLLLKLVRLESEKTIDFIIEETAKQYNLQLKNLVGIGGHIFSDDQKYSVESKFEKMQNKYKNEIFYPIFCITDSIQTAFKIAVLETFPEEIEYFIRDTYNWLYDNRSCYKILCELLQVELIQKYKHKFDDSWILILPAITNILKYWYTLEENLSKMKGQSSYIYELYDKYNSRFYKICLEFIEYHLKDEIEVNKEFENLIPDGNKMLTKFIALKSKISIFNEKYKVPENQLQLYYEKCINVPELRHVFLTYHKKFIKKFNKNLDLLYINNYTTYDSIRSKLNKLSLLNQNEEKITTIDELDEIKRSKIASEWKKLQSNLSTLTIDKIELQRSWEIIFNRKSEGVNPYKEISSLAMIYLSLPFSDFNIKRIFHQFNHEDTQKISDKNIISISNILMIQNYLKLMSNQTQSEKNSEYFFDMIHTEFMKKNVCDNHDYVLNQEEEEILVALKEKGNAEYTTNLDGQ